MLGLKRHAGRLDLERPLTVSTRRDFVNYLFSFDMVVGDCTPTVGLTRSNDLFSLTRENVDSD